MQKLKASRNELFNQIEKSALKQLPSAKYEIRNFKRLKAQFNYHILLSEDKHHYSIPWHFRRKQVSVFYTQTTVEILYKNQRIAFHKRNRMPNGYTTVKEHMPEKHQQQSDWHPQRFINWAHNIGESVEAVIVNVLSKHQHPEQGYKTCLGILNLAKKYGKDRLNKACERAIYFNHCSCKGIKNILENRLENYQEELFTPTSAHANIRGNQYYK